MVMGGMRPRASAAVQTDLSALFAVPTGEEMATVRADWVGRQPVLSAWTEVTSGTVLGHQMMVVSQRIDGELHYGAVRFPIGYDPARAYPVLIYNHKGNYLFLEAELATLDAVIAGNCPINEFIYVMPSFRGEYIYSSQLGGTYTSQGEQSRLNYDVDDSMALLTDVLAHIPAADPARVVSLGVSRGAGVSLLQGARDGRVRRLVDYFGPADLFLPSLQADATYWVDHNAPPPDAANDVVLERVMEIVWPYVNGSATLAESRQLLLQSSAVYFVGDMPPLQIHHGTADEAVPIAHSYSLVGKLEALGAEAPPYTYYVYVGGDHNIVDLSGSGERVVSFVCELIPSTVAAAVRSTPVPVAAGDPLTLMAVVTNTNQVSLTAVVTVEVPASVIPPTPVNWQITIPANETWTGSVTVQTAPDYLGPLTTHLVVVTREGPTAEADDENEALPFVMRTIFLPLVRRP